MLEQKDLEMIGSVVHQELQEVRTELKEEIRGVRTELKEEIQGVRTELKKELQEVRTDLEEKIQGVQTEVQSVKLTLEHEVNRNILIIAEGHSLLNNKLDEAIKGKGEREMLLLKMSIMENDIRILKEKMEKIEKTA